MKVKCYISHTIRGRDGNDATDETMEANNDKAKFTGELLRSEFPELELYIPAEMDDFLIPRGIRPVAIVEELLALDCAIVGCSDLLLVYNHQHYISGGMRREIDHAKAVDTPILEFNVPDDETLFRIGSVIKEILEEKLEEKPKFNKDICDQIGTDDGQYPLLEG